MTALAIQPAPVNFNREQIDLIKTQIAPGASDGELSLFVEQCQRTGLDPFSRQIYAVMREESKQVNGQWVKVQKMTIQVAIDGFRVIAERHGQYAGRVGPLWCGPDGKWVDVWLGKDMPAAAKVGILRHGFTEPLWAVARLEAYISRKRDGAPMGLWAKMPDVMIAKCAEAQALRAAFPNDLSGLYASEEMAQADNPAPESKAPQQARKADVTREEEPEMTSAEPVEVVRLPDDPQLLELWGVRVSQMEARVRTVAPASEVAAIRDRHPWAVSVDAARMTYEELKHLGMKYAPKTEPAPASNSDAEPMVSADQISQLQAIARSCGASTHDDRAALWAYMLNTGTPIGTKELEEKQAGILLEAFKDMDGPERQQTMSEAKAAAKGKLL
jgi:phage recombination protein Bet